MKVNNKKHRRKQSNLSRALASSNTKSVVLRHFFQNLTPSEIRRSVLGLYRHRHFTSAINPNKDGAVKMYVGYTPEMSFEKCIAWCMGILECHKSEIQNFINKQDELLTLILNEDYTQALAVVKEIERAVGISSWGVSLQGTLLSIIDPEAQRRFISKTVAASGANNFFKALTFNLTNRFDDPETVESESKFFELKIRRTFVGSRLHFLMYKLLPLNVEFEYDYDSVLEFEKNSSPVDIYNCLFDFLISNLNTTNEAQLALGSQILLDMRKLFDHSSISNLAVGYGLTPPNPISDQSIKVIDFYTMGDYTSVCELMEQEASLRNVFGLVEIWAKALTRLSTLQTDSLQHILNPLQAVLSKNTAYQRSRTGLLAYCHAFGMLIWFKELRYLLERETKFYDERINHDLLNTSLLLSSISTPAKAEVLYEKGYIDLEFSTTLVPEASVTARLFSRMNSTLNVEPNASELVGIEESRQLKFRAAWNVLRGRYDDAVPLLLEQLKSTDVRVAHDASRALVECYRATSDIEKAADIYVEALLNNINLLSIFDSAGLSKDCSKVIKASDSISVPIVFSLYSRFVSDDFDAALKYSFECFLKNSGFQNPLEFARSDKVSTQKAQYFLRYVCTPEVMKLYLYFDTPKEIEQCRIDICKILLASLDGDEELIFEVKDRTRRLVLREAVSQVQGSRIFSDVNLLSGPSSPAFKALFERFSALRHQDFEGWDDEITLKQFRSLMEREPLLRLNAHTIHVQDMVLNEKNSVFIKLVKLVRDEFAFGEKGLNVYLSTRIRHGHYPNTIRKALLDNALLASKATDTSAYKLGRDALEILRPSPQVVAPLEQAIVEFSIKFNDLVDEVNDKWLRLFTIDQDISGLSKDGEPSQSLFNYSVTAVEAYYLQCELSPKSSYTDFIAIASVWLWERTESNLSLIREKLASEMSVKSLMLLEELGKSMIQQYGIENLGDFPDALARARNGLSQAFDVVQGWFTRAEGTSIQSFELEIPTQIASMAIDVDVTVIDNCGLTWKGEMLNPLVDAFYILFENAASKSQLPKSEITVKFCCEILDSELNITVENKCSPVPDIDDANLRLERYRDPLSYQAVVNAAQGEGGSGFFKLWRLLEKDMSVSHQMRLGYVTSELFQVEIKIPLDECIKACGYENIVDRR